jgi:hypothetical protein
VACSALLEVHKYLEDIYLPAVEQDARPPAPPAPSPALAPFALREPFRTDAIGKPN